MAIKAGQYLVAACLIDAVRDFDALLCDPDPVNITRAPLQHISALTNGILMDVYGFVLKNKREVSDIKRLAVLLHRLGFSPPPTKASQRRWIKEASKLHKKNCQQRKACQSPGVSAEEHLDNAPACAAAIQAAANEVRSKHPSLAVQCHRAAAVHLAACVVQSLDQSDQESHLTSTQHDGSGDDDALVAESLVCDLPSAAAT